MGGQSASVIADLRKQKGTPGATIQINGIASENDGAGGNYFWNDTSTATDDGFSAIKVDNVTTGRWLRLRNSNSMSGTATFNVVIGTGSYTVNHGLSTAPARIFITPASANASAPAWVSAITATNFTVTFFGLPVQVLSNVSFHWLAIRT